ncbi:MAG: erythromycin esterase family protein, partial [Acidobacteriota bacterium]
MIIPGAAVVMFVSFLGTGAGAQGVTGLVRDSAGKPVAGAVVAAVELPTDPEDLRNVVKTDDGGHFVLPELTADTRYALTATAGGLLAQLSKPFRLKEGESRTMDLVLPRAGGHILSGTVRMNDGRPRVARILAGRFSEEEGDVFVTDTDGEGRYSVRLPDAMYSLKALVADGYAASERLTVSADATHDIQLERVFLGEPAAVAEWIRSAAIPLRTVDPLSDDDDLQPLGALVGDAHVVSLGEATHGTREFFQLKHRIIRYLVEKKGFTVFGIEATFPGTMAVENYVLGGDVTIDRALQGLQFWTWRTDEVRDLIEWMRTWNSTHPRKVHFRGIDMQDGQGEIRYIRQYLQRQDPLLSVALFAPLRPLLDSQKYTALPEAEKGRVIEAIDALAARIDATPAPSRDTAWVFAHHAVDTLRQTERSAHSARDRYSVRDQSMAENAKWFLDQEAKGAKMVLWAHNGHVAGESYPAATGGSMGVHLRRLYGADVVTLGFAFHRGTFRAMRADGGPFDDNRVEPSAVATFDNALSAAGLPLFLLDLRTAKGVASDWLRSPLRSRSIGAVFDTKAPPTAYLVTMKPLRSFDAVLFVEEGHSSRVSTPNPAGPAGPVAPPTPPAPAALDLGFEEGKDGEAPSG